MTSLAKTLTLAVRGAPAGRGPILWDPDDKQQNCVAEDEQIMAKDTDRVETHGQSILSNQWSELIGGAHSSTPMCRAPWELTGNQRFVASQKGLLRSHSWSHFGLVLRLLTFKHHRQNNCPNNCLPFRADTHSIRELQRHRPLQGSLAQADVPGTIYPVSGLTL